MFCSRRVIDLNSWVSIPLVDTTRSGKQDTLDAPLEYATNETTFSVRQDVKVCSTFSPVTSLQFEKVIQESIVFKLLTQLDVRFGKVVAKKDSISDRCRFVAFLAPIESIIGNRWQRDFSSILVESSKAE